MNLKDYARSRGTNIKKLAEQIGVTPSTLYAISNGTTDFDHIGISLFNRIADALNVTTDELYGILRYDNNDMSDDEFFLSTDEMQLVIAFRNMDDSYKEDALKAMKSLGDVRPDDERSSLLATRDINQLTISLMEKLV